MADARHSHEKNRQADAADIAPGHETSDASIPGLVVFLVGLTVMLVVVVFAIAWLFELFVERSKSQDPPPAPLVELRRQRPPAPRLQQSPALDMNAMRSVQLERLSEVRWIDQQAGVVQMPIEQAMQHLAGAGKATMDGGNLPRTEQTKQGFPNWPRVELDREGNTDAQQKEATPLPGTGKNPDAQPRKSVKEDQPSDVAPPDRATPGEDIQ